MNAEKSRPAREAGRPSNEVVADLHFENGTPPSVSQRTLNDEDVSALIANSDRDYQIWLNGYLYGLIHGAEAQRLADQQVAELAAQIAIAKVETQADVRATIRNAIRHIDVRAAREATRRRAENASRGAA